jgi:hypothetical protein
MIISWEVVFVGAIVIGFALAAIAFWMGMKQ